VRVGLSAGIKMEKKAFSLLTSAKKMNFEKENMVIMFDTMSQNCAK
jgi:hypothetical protein